MKRIISVLEAAVFSAVFVLFCTLAYQSMSGQDIPGVVGVSVMLMDGCFILVTLLRLAALRPRAGAFVFDILSVALILAALVMKAFHMPYSPLSLLVWNAYLLLLFGFRTAKTIIGRNQA